MQGVEGQLQEAQLALNQSRSKATDLQQGLEEQMQKEKRMQEQMQESIKAVESLASKWEEKYFKIYESWQVNELKVKELVKVEERYHKMQSLLSSLGGILGHPLMSQHAASFSEEEHSIVTPPSHDTPSTGFRNASPQPPPPSEEDFPEGEPAKPYQNLFDMPKSKNRPKNDLFD